jgi:hypothetical protein
MPERVVLCIFLRLALAWNHLIRRELPIDIPKSEKMLFNSRQTALTSNSGRPLLPSEPGRDLPDPRHQEPAQPL